MITDQMKVILATVFSFYLKAHYFHWNVTGPNFPEYHKFLEKLYKEVFDSVDDIAEKIRSMDTYAPGSLARFTSLTKIEDELNIPSASSMISQLASDNDIIIDLYKKARDNAEEQKMYGLVNFIEGRIDVHAKHAWMLKAIVK